ncbi:glycosyltransferase family 4 protein [Bacteroides sp. GD17]|jgi:glycosyltransferase involved in cell wall biosynthesis|uniref:glycosyltransferase family 4 protein n=1 Tax=Bacteroides sp. GD17 TaxID=3139826 RepID=UPI00313EE063
MKRRIWIVSEYYYPIVTSTGFYMTEIAEFLSRKGMDVHVICTGAKYNETASYVMKKYEEHNGVIIHRVLALGIDKNDFIKRALRILASSMCLFFLILKKVKKGDELLVVTNPAFLLVFMPLISFLKGIRYKLLVHDIFPENMVAIRRMKDSSFAYHFFRVIFNKSYSNADVCISIGRDMREILRKKTQGKTNIVLIPNWADNEDITPLCKKETFLYKKLHISSFIFQFAGNLGHAQGLDNILSAITLIDNEDISFLFIGGGAKADVIREFSRNRENVICLGFQDRSHQNDFLNMCDVGIVTLSDGMYGLGVPSKSYNIMAAGKPILYIGDENSEIALCIKEYSLGWVVVPDDPYALKDMIEYIYENRDNLDSIRNNARIIANTVFAKERILEEYYSLFA